MILPKFLSLVLFAAFCCSTSLWAADEPQTMALVIADDARVAAMTQANREQLEAIFAQDLRYAHASGNVDTKASLIDTLTAGKLKYVSFNYEVRNFSFPSPDIALMTGRARLQVVTPASDGVASQLVLGFLGVWKHEGDKWHFLAWQSCKLPDKAP